MTLPNVLTIFRVFVSPVFLLCYLLWQEPSIEKTFIPYLLLALLLIAELSDALDGFLARRYDQVSDFGKLLDPMADSLYRISVFLTFTLPPVSLPLLLVFVFIYRDSLISTLRTICALRGFALAARLTGKLKAVVQGTVTIFIVLLLLFFEQGFINQEELQTSAFWLTAVASLYTLYSGVDYLVANQRFIRLALTKKEFRLKKHRTKA